MHTDLSHSLQARRLTELGRAVGRRAFSVARMARGRVVTARAVAPPPVRVISLTEPWSRVHEAFDDETRCWVDGVLAGDLFAHAFPAADPEAAHDVARLRGVLPALAELYGRTRRGEVAERLRALLSWVEWCADRQPAAGWDSTTAALRLVSLLEARESVARAHLAWPVPAEWMGRFVARHTRSLATGQYLEPAGNHRLINTVGRCAARLLVRCEAPLPAGLAHELSSVLREQWLPDGGHMERSPHYHCQALVLAATMGEADARRGGTLRTQLASTLARPTAALAAMLDPGGAPLRLSDASRTFSGCHVAHDANVAAQSGAVGNELRSLPDFGIERRRWRTGEVKLELAADCGPMGGALNRGHAHADALSFLLHVNGAEVISDPGTYLYAGDAGSLWYKLPQAHSSVHWPHSPSHELSSFFRWKRIPPAPVLVSESDAAAGWDLCAAQGWGAAARRFDHVRWWSSSARGLTVTDQVSSTTGEAAVLRFHLAPAVEVRSHRGSQVLLRAGGQSLRIRFLSTAGGKLTIDETVHAARYGRSEPTSALQWRMEHTQPCTSVLTVIEVPA